MAYDNTNRWTLNKNANKRDGKKDPDYKGKIDIDGKLFWIDGWITQSHKGAFISGSVKAVVPREDQISSGRWPVFCWKSQ